MKPALVISVIVPTHDTRELTLACLAALARQELPGLEAIVVDDGSRDGTAEAVAAWGEETTALSLRVLRTEHSEGFTRAANRGLAAAGGEILLLLNSDTEVDPGGLDALLAAFAADPELGVAGGALHYPDGRRQWSGGPAPTLLWLFGLASGLPAWLGRLPLYRRLRPPAGTGPRPSWLRWLLRAGSFGRFAQPACTRITSVARPRSQAEPGLPHPVDWATGAALGLRRAALDAVGLLDEAFRFYGQDLDLCLRLAAAGWRVTVVPGFRVMHHHGATIGRRGEGRQHPELLWTDLLYWAGKARGGRWAARAAWAIRVGATLRLAVRRLARPFVPATERAGFTAGTAALRRALRAIRDPALAPPPPLV